MRSLGITSAALVFLLGGVAAPSFAQHGHEGDQGDQPSQQDNGHQKSKHNQSQHAQEQERARHGTWQEHRAQSWESDHRNWDQRGGYVGYRVPDTRYQRYFGPQHGFRIDRLPFRVASGHPTFQYHGYWLSVVDPWPEYWANDWYATDDVYVNYANNGYYLLNRQHPEVHIALRISM
jgi:hypothetical protein